MYNMFIMLLPEHRKILKVSNTGQQGYMANNFWNICIILSFFMYSLWASETLKVGSSSQEWMNDWLTGWFEWNGKNSKFFPQFEQVKPDNFALSDNCWQAATVPEMAGSVYKGGLGEVANSIRRLYSYYKWQ